MHLLAFFFFLEFQNCKRFPEQRAGGVHSGTDRLVDAKVMHQTTLQNSTFLTLTVQYMTKYLNTVAAMYKQYSSE